MKCPECRLDNPEGAKFCIDCGSPMEFHCPKCGAITPAKGELCMECARGLGKLKGTLVNDFSLPRPDTPQLSSGKPVTARRSMGEDMSSVTALLVDLANYGAIAEKLDPDEVNRVMDVCFRILMNVVHKHGGTINPFSGNGVVALFELRVSHVDHAERACYAALAMKKALEEYNEDSGKRLGLDLKIRIGVNSGSVLAGDHPKRALTRIGEVIDLASRVASMAESGSILVSRSTYTLANHIFDFEPVGKDWSKGKGEQKEAYRLIKACDARTRFESVAAGKLTRFVGREREKEFLKEAYHKVRSGSGQLVELVGEAGVGKSRLLCEFKEMLPEDEYTYLEGRCLHYGNTMAYLPLTDILRSYFDIEEEDQAPIVQKKIEARVTQLGEKLTNIPPPPPHRKSYLSEWTTRLSSGWNLSRREKGYLQLYESCLFEKVKRNLFFLPSRTSTGSTGLPRLS